MKIGQSKSPHTHPHTLAYKTENNTKRRATNNKLSIQNFLQPQLLPFLQLKRQNVILNSANVINHFIGKIERYLHSMTEEIHLLFSIFSLIVVRFCGYADCRFEWVLLGWHIFLLQLIWQLIVEQIVHIATNFFPSTVPVSVYRYSKKSLNIENDDCGRVMGMVW